MKRKIAIVLVVVTLVGLLAYAIMRLRKSSAITGLSGAAGVGPAFLSNDWQKISPGFNQPIQYKVTGETLASGVVASTKGKFW